MDKFLADLVRIIPELLVYPSSIFTMAMLVLFGLGILLCLLPPRLMSRFRAMLPSSIVTLGILGTFYGIYLGLQGFDSHNISESIPPFLDGMKTAFLTSLAGMALSLLLKMATHLLTDIVSRPSDSANLAGTLHAIERNTAQTRVALQSMEDTLARCFRSEEEYSLVNQVKLIRQEIIDSRRETQKAIDDFAEFFSEMASASLVEELQKVVDKFNAMLSELVGKAFTELSASMIELNAWQTQYKEHIHSTQDHLALLADNFQSHEEKMAAMLEAVQRFNTSLEDIDQSLSAISVSGDELAAHALTLAKQNQAMDAFISQIADIGREASHILPEFNEKVVQMVSQFDQTFAATNSFVQSATQNLDASVQEWRKNTDSFVEGLRENLTKQQNDSLEALSKALERELDEALQGFAGVMVRISERFAEDYTPLADKLRELVRVAADERSYAQSA